MPVKLTGKKGYPLTDQNNAAPKAAKKEDGLLPTKKSGRVNTPQMKSPGTQYKQGDAPKSSSKEDGVSEFEDGHMSGPQLSDGGRNSPSHGKSFLKKWSTNDMAQAVRGRSRKASPYAG